MAAPVGDGISFGAAAATAAAATILERDMSAPPAPEPEPEPATAGGSWGGETAQGKLVVFSCQLSVASVWRSDVAASLSDAAQTRT